MAERRPTSTPPARQIEQGRPASTPRAPKRGKNTEKIPENTRTSTPRARQPRNECTKGAGAEGARPLCGGGRRPPLISVFAALGCRGSRPFLYFSVLFPTVRGPRGRGRRPFLYLPRRGCRGRRLFCIFPYWFLYCFLYCFLYFRPAQFCTFSVLFPVFLGFTGSIESSWHTPFRLFLQGWVECWRGSPEVSGEP